MTQPNHVVIVPDGNRRWAKLQGKPSLFGHQEGAEAIEKILKTALELKVPCVTFWGCSVANVTERDQQEVRFLYDIFERYFAKLGKSKEVRENEVRVNMIGRWKELFPESLKRVMREVIGTTSAYSRYRLTFLMAYSGLDEMMAAIEKIRRSGGNPHPAPVNPGLVKQNLWTHDLPPVDLVIRTGGEPHWSAGMMMWDVAEAQLYFTKTLWPAFSPEEFTAALNSYAGTERRFGK